MNGFMLMQKRLFSRPSFLIVLLLLPMLIGAIRLGSLGTKGVITIALYSADKELGKDLERNLKTYDKVLNYLYPGSKEEAVEAVSSYRADMAWTVPKDMRERLQEYAETGMVEPSVTVYVREDAVTAHFAMEILEGALYPRMAYEVFADMVRGELGLTDFSDTELQAYYDAAMIDGNLFRMVTPDETDQEITSILLSPMRGICGLWLMICFFAAQFITMKDEKSGVYAGKDKKKAGLLMCFWQLAYALDAFVVFLVSVAVSGLWNGFLRELGCGLLYVITGLLFANLIRIFCGGSEAAFCGIMVLTLLSMVILCPIFIDIPGMRTVQSVLPLYHYLQGIYSMRYALHAWPAYTAVLGLTFAGLSVIYGKSKQ